MPRLIEACSPPLGLQEAIAALDELAFDPRNEAHICAGARVLAGLHANRTFLGDVLLDLLHHDAGDHAGYGPQAIMLSDARPGYFLRANIWPAESDQPYRTSGGNGFVYGVPHDHNFDFLTCGYLGPGYESDYYEYEYDSVVGMVNEPVALRFVERRALAPGEILHYRAHRDVHVQWPAAALSVSINICAANPALGWFDQYRFDLDGRRVDAILNPCANEVLLRCGVALGHPEMLDLAEHFSRSHPSDRIRLAAFEARANSATDRAARDAIWAEAEYSGSRLVSETATARRRSLG